MKDELYKKIVEGLSGSLNGNEFEECAVDLLQLTYPNLVPVKGGNDDGRDGYLFDSAVGSGPLVCTTSKDVSGNLRKNLKKYVETGHKGHSVVVATSRALTPERINNLYTVAAQEGFSIIQVHEQSDFANRLYRNKEWLKKLLGIESNQQALSITPVTSRPILSSLVRGRDDLTDWLNKVAGDIVIVGQPGSGKTFAVRSYTADNEGLFVVSEDRNQIAAEVRDKRPRFLIVDDAHLKLELLQSLRQIREDTGAEYRILATSWLSHRDAVRETLSVSDDAVFELRLLGRDMMVQIIKDCGVIGPDPLLREMVTQAEGKPGLAATLSQLVLAGKIRDVYVGDALGKHLVTLFERDVGSDASDVLGLLAVAALGGDSGISLDAAAEILKTSESRIQYLASQLAFGGVIAETGRDGISVRPPPFRSYLVKRHFFSKKASTDPLRYLSKYPKQSDAIDVILRVALIGGEVDRERLYHLIEETGLPSLFGGYASLGKREAGRVIDEHPDMALRAARALLDIYPEGILPLMLDKAVGDNRPLHSHPEHPMRIIQDWCKAVGYDNTIPIGNRDMLLGVLSSWCERVSQGKVTAQALAAIFCPRIEFLRPDPGSGHTFAFGKGHLSATALQHLIDLLPTARLYFMVRGTDGLKELVGLLHDWVYEMPLMGETVTDEQKLLLHTGACLILSYVDQAAKGHLGIQVKLRQYARELGVQIECDSDEEYETIHPIEENARDGFEKVVATQRAAALLLAADYSKCDPTEVIAKLAHYDKFAQDANSSWPDYSIDVVSYLAEHVANIDEWARVSVTECDNPFYSYPLLARFYETDPARGKNLLLKSLDNSCHVGAAAQVILRRPFEDDTLWKEVFLLLKDMVWIVFGLVLRGELGDLTILELLKHPSDEVAMMVAAALAQKDDGKIRNLFAESWENALVKYQFNEGPNDHYVGIALRQHPETIVRWLKAKTAEDTEQYEGNFAETVEDLVQVLSKDQRAEVINILQTNRRSQLAATHLVGDAPHLFKCVLDNPNASAYRLDALAKVSGPAWRKFAEIAIEAGIDDRDIESASSGLGGTWTGPFSKHLLDLSLRFKEGLDSSQPRVAVIARKCMDSFQKMSDKELEREKKEEIYG